MYRSKNHRSSSTALLDINRKIREKQQKEAKDHVQFDSNTKNTHKMVKPINVGKVKVT